MILTWVKQHLSVAAFDEISLPDFALVSGANGSGKTHFLRAIENGSIRTDVATNQGGEIRYFDWTNLVPNEAGSASTASVYSERDRLLTALKKAKDQARSDLQKHVARSGLDAVDPLTLLQLDERDLEAKLMASGAASKSKQIVAVVANIRRNIARQMLHDTGDSPSARSVVETLEARLPGGLASAVTKDFDQLPVGWAKTNLFEQSFAHMFLSYFEAYKQNQLLKLDRQEGRETPYPPLDDASFREKHGEPPWDFVNAAIRDAGLGFEVDHPIEYTTSVFAPRLMKTGTGADIGFKDLSSGERVLMSFAFCLYYSIDARQLVQKPKLLLFDEIDAPLHPAMSRHIVRTINEALVGRHGVKVMMVTHSPSTIAVAPEESIFTMTAGVPGLRRTTKRQAIAALTSEIPTLSIDFSGRRQVFVESRFDAERYDRLFRIASQMLTHERSLVFVSVGARRTGGAEEASGCDQVRRLVAELSEAGNESVFGLVDWDLKNEPLSRVHVLAYRKRYAIENCLLDPLLVALAAVRERREFGAQIGLSATETVADLAVASLPRLQGIVDEIQRLILGDQFSSLGPRVGCAYVGGAELQVSEKYLRCQGHALEERVIEAIPHLRRLREQGKLLMYVVDPVLVEHPKLLPRDVLDAFDGLLSAPT